MGWTVLYIAFGIVALWLLGEVLLQYKARLRWRLLAFAGFLGVVVGVLMASVVVIGIGAAAFAVGQTYVTLSFRRGFVAGWAVKRPEDEAGDGPAGGFGAVPGVGSKRRRGKKDRQEAVLEVSDLEPEESGYAEEAAAYRRDGLAYGQEDDDRDDVFAPGRPPAPTAAEATAVYEPQPIPDDTGNYGVYGDSGAAGYPGAAQSGQQPASPDQDYAAAAQGTGQNYGYDYSGYGQQQYGYDANGQQQYAGYSDPYGNGGQAYDPSGASYDAYGQQQYGQQQGYGQDQYGTSGTGGNAETPAGGVWVPQQRNDESYGGALPPEQPYPYQQTGDGQQQTGGYDDQQYRF
ncbi:hypothetical protein [Streptomyces sp. NPDC047000]|uniref:SCO2102 family sporulation regulator n=1 Tax=Streptomyces sp. NPDC047000 TaxID=3155474 RepID=UPI0034063D32